MELTNIDDDYNDNTMFSDVGSNQKDDDADRI